MDKKDNPMSRLMELAAPYKGEYVLSVILAILGVAAGLLPFFAVSKIVILLMDGETSVAVYMEWCLLCKFIYFSFPYGHFRNSGGNPPETSR